jgi:isopenicillin N synthase-like dioxygenase
MAPAASETAIPLIDLGPFTIPGYTKSTKDDVLREVARACETVGCFYLQNHGIDRQLIKNVISDLRAFFDQSPAYKLKYIDPLGDVNRGYVGFEQQNLNAFMGRQGMPNDPLEKYLLSPPRSDVTKVAEDLWPDHPSTFKANISQYYNSLRKLSEMLLRVFSLALNVPGYEDFFYRQCAEADTCRLKNHLYPPNGKKKENQYDRFPEHTDSTPFALLSTDACKGALQVLDERDGKWIVADSMEDTLILNLGDSMARWTNDRWKAPVHKVAWPRRKKKSVACPWSISRTPIPTLSWKPYPLWYRKERNPNTNRYPTRIM